jgi:hypothetical protein
MSVSTGDLVSRTYGNFRGVDFRGEDINIRRSPDSLNVWHDYQEIESIRTRPSMVLKTGFEGVVYGIFFYNGQMLVHCVDKLYKVVNGAKTVLYSGLAQRESNAFIFESVWYFMDGKHYLQYDGTTVKAVEGFVPTTSIGRKPSGGGTIYQDVNMLSEYRINTFVADGESTKYYLDAQDIDDTFAEVTVNGEDVISYSINENGYVTFMKAPDAPLTDGQDNVSIKFRKKVNGYREKVLNCTMLQVFDNRVFVSGNKDYPNTVWHCSLDDPTYFSDLDYYREGVDSARVMGLVAGNNNLWVFREPSQANTSVFYHTPSIDEEYGKVYPSQHSSISTGCVGKAVNFNDDILFFSERGMEGISGDITTEQAVSHRSTLVDRKLTAEKNYASMILAEWEGYLLTFIGDKAYLADSRAMFTNENHTEYDFFYWQMEKEITAARVDNGILYLGTKDGVYTLTGEGNLESYWVTPKDKFKSAYKLKTTNKRGCVVEASGDLSVYAKVEDTDFELIDSFENITDYFVCRIKRKKWKDIQLKFYSNTRFSLETATLEAFIGGYIKR